MKAKLMLCLCLLLAATTMFAQNLTVTGVVTEKATGYPAIGVSVLVKGTTNGTITSMDGDYTLSNVPKNATLVFSYVGMTTQEVPVNGQTVVNVLMSEDTQNLEEVVVIGYGTSKAKDLTAPIAVIKADEITKHATSSPMSALQGKVPGVQITNSGQPGSGPSVRIRGIGSMNTDSQPLYVVDGMFFDNIDFLNNSDIQDLSILKDASAASIYGVRAANGVVLVTTKKGALNRPATVTYDGYVGFQKATNVLKMANSEQYATMISEMGNETLQAVVNNAKNVWGTLPNTNWYDEILHTALTHNHSLDISGGTEKATYSVGTSYLYQDGILDSKNDYSRFNLRTKADYKAFDWLKVGANVVLSNSTQNLPNGEVWLAAFRTPGIIPVYDENSSLNPYPTKYGSPAQIGLSEYYYNPVAQAEYYDSKNSMLRVMPSFYAQFDFLPENKLFFKTAYSQDINVIQTRAYTPEFLVGGTQLNSTPLLNKKNDIYHSWILDNTLTYTDTFGDHGLTAMLGQSVREENWRNLWGEATGVPGGHEEYYYLNQGNADGRKTGDDGTTYRGVSWFGRVSYDYKGKYLFETNGRYDGSSKFPKKNRFGFFPSVSVGWNIARENFMKPVAIGNQGIDPYKFVPTMSQVEKKDVAWLVNGAKPLTLNAPGLVSDSFTWETVETLDFGFDITALNGRLQSTFDWYRRDTKDMLAPGAELPSVVGASAPLQNTADLRTKGWELSLTWRDRIGAWGYNVGFNLYDSKTVVTKYHNESKIILKSDGTNNYYEGYEIGSIWGYVTDGYYTADDFEDTNTWKLKEGVVTVDGVSPRPGDIKYQNLRDDGSSTNRIDTGDGTFDNPGDRKIIGNNSLRLQYGINLGVNYKGFDLSVLLQGVGKRDVWISDARRWPFNSGQFGSLFKDQLDYWKPVDSANGDWTAANPNAEYFRIYGQGNNSGYNTRAQTKYLMNGSYLRVKNVTLSYNFPKSWLAPITLTSLKAFVSCENLHTFTKLMKGYDPERLSWGYPFYRTISFGFNVTL